MKRITLLMVLIFVIICSGFAADRELFREAEGRYRSGNYAAALDLYTRFISENRISPDAPDAQFKMAVCLYQLGRFQESLDRFSKIAKSYSSTEFLKMVPFWQGRISLELNDYKAAVGYLDEYIRSGGSVLVPEAYLYRAMSYEKLGMADNAEYSLELMLNMENFTDDGYITSLLSSSYLKQGKSERILELAAASADSTFKPEYRNRMLLYKAEALYMNGDFTAAEKIYGNLTELDDPGMSVAWQRLFTIYKKQGRDDQLKEILRDAEKKLKGKPEVLGDFRMRIGIASYNAGDYQTAEKYFLTIWDTSAPSVINGLVPLYYSKILEKKEQSVRAVEILEIFLSESEDRSAEILVRLAELYTLQKDLGRAESRLDEFFRDFSESDFFFEAAYLKAYICYRQGRYDEALSYAAHSYSADEKGERTASLLRLESTLLKKTGKYRAAEDRLVRYLDYQPADIRAKLDLFRLRFMLKEYKTILVETIDFKWSPEVRDGDLQAYLLSTYMSGLSAIALSDYSRAVDDLTLITPVNSAQTGLTEIYPYALFYKGWALYRSADYQSAAAAFDELTVKYPESASSAEASYLAGWCEYIIGDYEKSSSYFMKYSSLAGGEDRGKFMYAKNLTALGRYHEAANIFAGITRNNETSVLADDALFEKAALFALMGDIEQAAADYEYLYRKYGGKLAEEGMFRRGELFYSAGKYADASEAYYEFRRIYPRSSLYDAALYWGGMSLSGNSEAFGAALLWENIINNYRDSVFRAPAMLKTAEIYSAAGDYSSALAMYERCRLEYPGTERAAAAAHESEKLRLLIGGLSEREAELNVVITREGGAGSAAGRRAMIELSALYISMGGSDLKPAISMLRQVAEHKADDAEAAADAQFYIGEYYYRQNNFTEAVKAFITAAGINPADKDSSARALYRAADTAVLAGSRSDAVQLIQRLKNYYPGTEWAVEADKLLGGAE